VTLTLVASRFPVLAGLRVEWESAREPGVRVRSVRLLKERTAGGAPDPDDEEDVPREGGRKYALLTREYMAQVRDSIGGRAGEMLSARRAMMDSWHSRARSTLSTTRRAK
jgi:5'-nucleotidase